jgi:hypothetical protein
MAHSRRLRGPSGIAIVALFLTIGAVAIPPDAPLHPWLGLLQRLTLALWFAATIVLAFRLLRIATAAEVRAGSAPAPAPHPYQDSRGPAARKSLGGQGSRPWR